MKSLKILLAFTIKFVILNTFGFTKTKRFSSVMVYTHPECIHVVIRNSVNFLDYCCLGNSLSVQKCAERTKKILSSVMTYPIICWGIMSDRLQSVVWNGQISHCFDVFLSGFLTYCSRCTKSHMESAGLCDLALPFIQKNIFLRQFNSLLNWKQQWCYWSIHTPSSSFLFRTLWST